MTQSLGYWVWFAPSKVNMADTENISSWSSSMERVTTEHIPGTMVSARVAMCIPNAVLNCSFWVSARPESHCECLNNLTN